MSAQLSFDMMCRHRALFLPLFLSPASNRPMVEVASKLSTMGNVVCRSSLLVSLRALTIHNGTLAVTVTWRCHLVLHTSAQISRQGAVLTNRDFTLSNKSLPQRRPLIGLASWHCCWWIWEEDGNPLKKPSANSCWQFQGCVWQECSCAMVWRHFLKPTLLYSHPYPFQFTASQKACGTPRHCSLASKKNFHVAMLLFGFCTPVVALRLQPLSHGLQM